MSRQATVVGVDASPEAFEQELLSSIEAVHRFALRLARDAAAAEDLVQETYLRALAHRDQYTPGTNCRAWLFTIGRNAFVKGAMRDAREVATDDAELETMSAAAVYEAVAASDPTGAVFERTDVDAALRKALDKLPEEYRTVVALVDIEDQSYRAVAASLGIPAGTVRSRLFRGRRLLRQDLLAYAMDAGLLPARMKPDDLLPSRDHRAVGLSGRRAAGRAGGAHRGSLEGLRPVTRSTASSTRSSPRWRVGAPQVSVPPQRWSRKELRSLPTQEAAMATP